MDFDSAQAYHFLVHGGRHLEEIIHTEIYGVHNSRQDIL